MIYLTGDTHGGHDVRKIITRNITEKLTADDTLIICGDFGFIWNTKKETHKEKTWLDWFRDRPWTTVFVDGNHECFPRLFSYPEAEWHGGRVNVIRDNLFHLMRGQVYTIEGHTFFAMGGAASHDRGPAVGDTKAVIGKYWWPQELPSEEEIQTAEDNLAGVNHHVDYIITHCIPSSVQTIVTDGKFPPDALTEFLEKVMQETKYTRWYAGHYHQDEDLDPAITLLFNKVIQLGDYVSCSKPLPGTPVYHRDDLVVFRHDGIEDIGHIRNIYPWGSMRRHDQPFYDIQTETGLIHMVAEEDILKAAAD